MFFARRISIDGFGKEACGSFGVAGEDIPGAARYRNTEILRERQIFLIFWNFYFAQVIIFVYLIINFSLENRASYCHLIAA
jgi:hypothetical protein